MKTRLVNLLEVIRSSYWFLPTVMSLAAVALSLLMLTLDRRYGDRIPADTLLIYGGDHEGARTVLSSIAGSMISVTSVVFSITIVALTLAAGQFGSRMLRNFMRDPGNQSTLGIFVATFVYAMLILRTVRGTENGEFVPALSVSVGILLMFTSVGFLIFFIHHIASSIQADSVVKKVSREVKHAIDRIYPALDDHARPPQVEDPVALLPPRFAQQAIRLRSPRDDYLQAIDQESLLQKATRHDLVIRLLARPGDFIIEGSGLADVMGTEEGSEVVSELREAFLLGSVRTMEQDVEFGMLQLVEVAVRALSPGINDPFTAITCIDRLCSRLSQLAGKQIPGPACVDHEGTLRVVVDTASFTGLTDSAFHQIRQNAPATPAVLIRLLEGIGSVAEHARTQEQQSALERHADLVLDAGLASIRSDADQADLRRAHGWAKGALERARAGSGA